ncbi:MAG: HAMP domain-containing sensor histidine kinase [Planctomycetota bacterium]
MPLRRRRTLRLQLTLWFVVALVAVESAVVFAYWVSREEPLIETAERRLTNAVAGLRPLLETRDIFRWRSEELRLLALRADLDVLTVVVADGTRVAGDDPVFPAHAVEALIRDGHATWTLDHVELLDPATPSAPKGGADSISRAESAPEVSRKETRFELLPTWPVVGAAVPFSDLFGRSAFLIGASSAPSAAPPAVLRAVAWVAIIGLLSAALAAWVVLGRALRPLIELAASARHISPERRDGRLEAGGGQLEVEGARRSLNEALGRLEAGYDALDLFIGNVTHELRTPIATVLAEARQLAIRERDTAEYAAFVRNTGDEMSRLGKKIQSFLTLARMDWEERRGMVMPLSLFDLSIDVVQLAQGAAQGHGVRIVLNLPEDGDIALEGDPELVTSMVDNLVRNAVRFSPPNDVVTIALSEEAEHAVIRVRDRGPGIPQSLIEGVFEPFVQSAESKRQGRGSGIGLAIAQKVVELHRGQISIGNHPDGGCEVVVRLPLTIERPHDPEDALDDSADDGPGPRSSTDEPDGIGAA